MYCIRGLATYYAIRIYVRTADISGLPRSLDSAELYTEM